MPSGQDCLGILLPNRYSPPTPTNLARYLTDLLKFLTSSLAQTIFTTHPNDAALDSFRAPELWKDWWEWAGLDTKSQCWECLVHSSFGVFRVVLCLCRF